METGSIAQPLEKRHFRAHHILKLTTTAFWNHSTSFGANKTAPNMLSPDMGIATTYSAEDTNARHTCKSISSGNVTSHTRRNTRGNRAYPL
jgi:hypothetical protein